MTWNCGFGYAPESMLDNKGRRIMWAGLYDSRPVWGDNHYLTQHAWDGVLTLPRVLSLDKNNDLLMEPVQELRALRANRIQKKNLTVKDSQLKIDDIKGNDLELDITISDQGAKEFGIKVCCSPDGSEETSITYDTQKKAVLIDFSKTSLDKSLMDWIYKWGGYIQEAKLELKSNETLNFHIFLDRSVMEVFVNNRLCLTHRIYPTRDDSKGIVLFAKGGKIKVTKFDAWKIHPSNPW
jgi:beta-fructofuranosidase